MRCGFSRSVTGARSYDNEVSCAAEGFRLVDMRRYQVTKPNLGANNNLDFDRDGQSCRELSSSAAEAAHEIAVALLTGGGDRHYVFGLTTSLMSKGVVLDLIGSDDLVFPEILDKPGLNFLNLRGSHKSDASFANKVSRIAMYYAKLIRYTATAKPRLFHILWNNKFELFDRTLLMLYYRLLGKRIVFTAHNVNAGRRDFRDTPLNRLTLRIQYQLAHHILVHTEKMKNELVEEFGVRGTRITVIPFGINNAVPNTCLTPGEAKQRLGIDEGKKTILFFGRITPYKGLECVIAAFRQISSKHEDFRLVIAGQMDRCQKYWAAIREDIRDEVQEGRVLLRDEFIPDDETEVYFKAADALVLAYTHIYQSGVLFLGHSFGLPVLAADVGSFKEEIVEGKTGFVFRTKDPADLANTIERYFASDLYAELNSRRREIQDYAREGHSWDAVSQITMSVYAGLLRIPFPGKSLNSDVASSALDARAPS